MMRVMVVEDEEMIRKGIVMAVDWAALDCIVVGEAAHGEQARHDHSRGDIDDVIRRIELA